MASLPILSHNSSDGGGGEWVVTHSADYSIRCTGHLTRKDDTATKRERRERTLEVTAVSICFGQQ